MSDNIVNFEDDKPVELRPRVVKWKHPDPKLADICLHASAMGTPISRLARMVGVKVEVLKNHYGDNVFAGKDMASNRLHEVAYQEALKGDAKLLQFLIKRSDDQEKILNEKEASKSSNTEEIAKLDMSKLTLEEAAMMYRLMSKAKPCIEVKGRVVDTPTPQ